MSDILTRVERVYFVGIGGIGISALARLFLVAGKRVSGCNENRSKITEMLMRTGIKVDIGQSLELVPRDLDLIVYSNAIKVAAPEFLEELSTLGLPLQSYPAVLGEIACGYYTIAVAGTHGKTTTTAMLAKIMMEAGLDPTVVVGALLLDGPTAELTNFIAPSTRFGAGGRNYLLVEADEYQRAFLSLSPQVLVITNIDLDHLDYYHDLADIQSAFVALATKVPADGFVIYDGAQANLAPVIEAVTAKRIDYSALAGRSDELKLMVPGRHNLANARATLGAAEALGIAPARALEALSHFKGVWRRFEFVGRMSSGALVYDDYAHNPPKIRAALQGTREAFPSKKIIAVFQPHLYSRTRALFADFAISFTDADEVIVTDIYAAREKPDSRVSSVDLAAAIRQTGKTARHLASFSEIISYLKRVAVADEVIILLGAGDISRLGDSLV